MNDGKWWAAGAMTAVNGLVSAGFSIAALVTADGSARVLALYAAARSVPLALATLVYLARRATPELRTLALVLAATQALDALIGFTLHDPGKTIGPAVFAILTLAGRAWLQAGIGPNPPRSMS